MCEGAGAPGTAEPEETEETHRWRRGGDGAGATMGGSVIPSLMGVRLRTLVLGADLPGYASLIVAILFLGGIQLIGIGVLGEYIGRIYVDVKRRPHYFVRSIYR